MLDPSLQSRCRPTVSNLHNNLGVWPRLPAATDKSILLRYYHCLERKYSIQVVVICMKRRNFRRFSRESSVARTPTQRNDGNHAHRAHSDATTFLNLPYSRLQKEPTILGRKNPLGTSSLSNHVNSKTY